MKTQNVIWIALLFAIIGSIVCLASCKKQQQTYTVKGYMYIGEGKTPYGNQSFDIGVYDKDKGWLNTKDGYVWQSTIGTAKSNNDGYIEFSYSHQRKGKFLKFTQDLTGFYKDAEFLIPINTDVTVEFYKPPHGWAAIFLNTNGKLNEEDTFFIAHWDFYKPSSVGQFPQGYVIDTVLGNFNGFIKSIKVPNTEVQIWSGKGRNSMNKPTRYYYTPTGHPHIDSIYIEY